jgi:hypothetical protein
MMLKGSCLCKAVTYSISKPLGPISHCHCKTCQKAHAAAFGTVARVPSASFKIESGRKMLTAYKSSPHKTRYFCSRCGTQIYADFDGQDQYSIRLGTLDDDPHQKPIRHIFVSEKAPWYDIEDKLEQFDQWPQ